MTIKERLFFIANIQFHFLGRKQTFIYILEFNLVPEFRVSDDTVMHLATAEGKFIKLFTLLIYNFSIATISAKLDCIFLKRYKKCI